MATDTRKVTYPTSDGEPMGETPIHIHVIREVWTILQNHVAADPTFYVRSNMLIFYEEGDPYKFLVPDIFAARGIEPKDDADRENFLIWQEARPPEVVFEITSKTTRRRDVLEKLDLYRDRMGVLEYFLFDPMSVYLKPPMQAYRFDAGRTEAIAPVDGRLPSDVLGLHFERDREDSRRLRVYDPASGSYLKTDREELQAVQAEAAGDRAEAQRAREQADRAQAQADRAQAQADRAQAEAERARNQAERDRVRAKRAGDKARLAVARAAEEAESRRRAEEEVRRLQREIEALRGRGQAGP